MRKAELASPKTIKLKFPFDEGIISLIREIPGRRYYQTNVERYWKIPFSVANIKKIIKMQFKLSNDLKEIYKTKRKQRNIRLASLKEITIPGLKKQLYPYQNTGVAFLETRQGRALIADEMGLGKTAQTLAWLQLHPEKRPAIIVVPASLKLNWERECQTWMSCPKTQILSGKTTTKIVGDIIIINYDIISAWVNTLKKIKPQVLVTDEAHKWKNSKTKRTKAIKALGKDCPHVIALSGTPIESRPAEIYNAIHMIDPEIAGPWMAFGKRYCAGYHNGWGWQFTGASNTQELHKKLTTSIMLRRKKKDVLPDLPDKIRTSIPIQIDNRKTYEEIKEDFLKWIRNEKGLKAMERAIKAETLARISVLKQTAAAGKIKQIIQWVENHLDNPGKLVIFAVHKKMIQQLMEELSSYNPVKIDGSTSLVNRQKAVDVFQGQTNCRILIGNINAAGVGLTLTAANSIAFVELPWAPAELSQAEDRCHRIGQKNCVNIYYLIAQSTIEEMILNLLHNKLKTISSIIDGDDNSPDTDIFQKIVDSLISIK